MCGFSIGIDTPTWWTEYYRGMKNNKRTQTLKRIKKKKIKERHHRIYLIKVHKEKPTNPRSQKHGCCMTTHPPKTNDHNIGCSNFLLRLKAKELNVPNNSRKVRTSIMLTVNNINIAIHSEKDPTPTQSPSHSIQAFTCW